MASTVQKPPEQKPAVQKPRFSSTVLLALWRLRRTWGMLLITGVGMVTAVLLVCAIPLYSQITMTAGLHSTLTENSQNSTLSIHASLEGLSSTSVGQISKTFNTLMRNNLATYIEPADISSLQMQSGMQLLSPKPANVNDTLALLSYDMNQVGSHAKIVRGRLPSSTYTTSGQGSMEVAITQQTALTFKLDVGSTMTAQFVGYSGPIDDSSRQAETLNLSFQVVGIYTADSVGDAFWGRYDANPVVIDSQQQVSQVRYSALVSNAALLQLLDQTAQTVKGGKPGTDNLLFSSQVTDLYLYYRLNSRQLSTDILPQLLKAMQNVQANVSSNYGTQQILPAYPYIQVAALTGPAISSQQNVGLIELYSNRVDLTYIPVTILMALAVGLILFFVAMMANLLVDRQLTTIAILRSRGASRGQIFGSFVVQSLGLALLSLFAGSLLAQPVVYVLTQRTFGANGQGALDLIFSSPLKPLGMIWYYALAGILVCIMTMMFCVYRAVSFDVLALRRETARSTARTIWQRLNLDIVAIVIALTGFGASLYLSHVQDLNAQTSALVVAPLSLIAPIFLALAVILILMRVYPLLLSLTARVVGYGRGVSAILAVGQMARSPRQALRMTLLLALASAFAIFSLVFSASQGQHAIDIANYQVGSDLYGTLPAPTLRMTATGELKALQSVSGVRSIAPAYTAKYSVQGDDPNSTFPLQVLAIDPTNFAKTLNWPQQFSSQSLNSMMQQLVALRQQAVKQNNLPAIVDALTWQRLGLVPNQTFQIMIDSNTYVTCTAIVEVQHIPTIDDSSDNTSSGLPGGVLIDYQTFSKVVPAVASNSAKMTGVTESQPVLDYNIAWFRTVDDPAQIARIHTALTGLHVTSLLDRRQLANTLRNDPLYLSLAGELLLAATAALLLALSGSLLGSWLSTRMRLTNFALLRALGTSLRQVAGVLSWEQAITYITAILLGAILGALLSVTIVPSLVSSSVPYNTIQVTAIAGASYALEHILPVQIIVPLSLILIFAALVVICVVVLTMMVRVVTRPALGQELRLNED